MDAVLRLIRLEKVYFSMKRKNRREEESVVSSGAEECQLDEVPR